MGPPWSSWPNIRSKYALINAQINGLKINTSKSPKSTLPNISHCIAGIHIYRFAKLPEGLISWDVYCHAWLWSSKFDRRLGTQRSATRIEIIPPCPLRGDTAFPMSQLRQQTNQGTRASTWIYMILERIICIVLF